MNESATLGEIDARNSRWTPASNHLNADRSFFCEVRGGSVKKVIGANWGTTAIRLLLTLFQLPKIVNLAAKAGELLGSADEAAGDFNARF